MEKLENEMIFHSLSTLGLFYEPYKTPKGFTDQERDSFVLLPLIGLQE